MSLGHSRGGRLPPLRAIGRSQHIDLDDEPHDLDEDDIDNFIDSYQLDSQRTIHTPPYIYEPSHADATAVALGSMFKTLEPGGHVCKRSLAQPSTSFTHCKASTKFGTMFSQLRHLLETKARLQLIRDFITRLNALAMFVKDLERVVQEDMGKWHDICHGLLEVPPSTHIESLSAFLEDLRLHMNHWNSLKQLLHTDRWLRRHRSKLTIQLEKIQNALSQLRNQALWWIDRLIHVGLKVLAHCDLERLSQDSLWSITRGLEDFNCLVVAVKLENTSLLPDVHGVPSTPPHLPTPVITNHLKHITECLKPIPFARVLNMLANERAQYAAAATMDFFTGNPDFLKILLHSSLPEYSWMDNKTSRASSKSQSGVDTSDYHSASGSHLSLSTTMLQVSGVMAPDLSKQPSPIFEFSKREQNFANRFLQIVCHSTSLLKKPGGLHSSRAGSLKAGKRDISTGHSPELSKSPKPTAKWQENSVNHKDTSSGPGLPIPSKSRSRHSKTSDERSETSNDTDSPGHLKRKSVSWGDAAEVTIIQQLSQRYLELLWQYLNPHLSQFLTEPAWRVSSRAAGDSELVTDRLGSVYLCPSTALMMVVSMIQHTSVKDIFPTGAVTSLLTVSQRLQASCAWTAWDHVHAESSADLSHVAYSSALASQVADKCKPIPLADGDSCSSTALLLRNAYQPLAALLRSLQLPNGDTGAKSTSKNTSSWQPGRNVTCTLLLSTLHALNTTFDLASKWCHLKSAQFIASKSVGSFLLVTQSDLKMLSDESYHALQLCQYACTRRPERSVIPSGSLTAWTESFVQAQLETAWQALNSVNAHMQMLSGSCVKQFQEQCTAEAREFFMDEMKPGKEWRRKTLQAMPSEANPYVEQAIHTLLLPVVHGAQQLKTTGQLAAVSVAVTAMCDAWTEHILAHRIRFSLHGAHQLEQDFLSLRRWLEGNLAQDDVRHSILALDVFKYLSGITGLLKRQPQGRSQGPPSNRRYNARPISSATTASELHASGYTESCEVSVSTSSSVDPYTINTESTLPSNNHDDYPTNHYTPPEHRCSEDKSAVANGFSSVSGGDEDVVQLYKVAKMEQWLALRVHGGSRHWPKFPSCFNNPHS